MAAAGPATTIILGGGITGLVAAFELAQGQGGERVALVEAGGRLGGKILTTPFARRLVDEAADALVNREPMAAALLDRLGLGGGLVSPRSVTPRLFASGQLTPFPIGGVLGVPLRPATAEAGPLLSRESLDRIALEPTLDPSRWNEPGADATIAELVRDRLGDGALGIIGPLLGGINGGDPSLTSVSMTAPQFLAALADHGSIVDGLRAGAIERAGTPPFIAPTGGVGALIDALEAAILDLGGTILRNSIATSLSPHAGGWRVTAGDHTLDADDVVVALPAGPAANLIADAAPEAAAGIAAIAYTSVTLVTLAFDPSDIGFDTASSGFLVDPAAGLDLTACSIASSKWEHLASPDVVVLRISTGREGKEEAQEHDDADLIERLLRDLDHVGGLGGAPSTVRVSRWPKSFPRYRVGHRELASSARGQLSRDAPGLWLAGAALDGVGIPTLIRSATEIAAAIIERRP